MNIKTHTVYPEIQLNDSATEFTVRLYDVEGHVKESMSGTGTNQDDCVLKAQAFITKNEPKYLRGK